MAFQCLASRRGRYVGRAGLPAGAERTEVESPELLGFPEQDPFVVARRRHSVPVARERGVVDWSDVAQERRPGGPAARHRPDLRRAVLTGGDDPAFVARKGQGFNRLPDREGRDALPAQVTQSFSFPLA
jgi:hypothetical protein